MRFFANFLPEALGMILPLTVMGRKRKQYVRERENGFSFGHLKFESPVKYPVVK